MKKRILSSLGWLFCLPALWAQSPVSAVTYAPNPNRDRTNRTNPLDAMQLNVGARGPFTGKQAELVCFTVQGDTTDSIRIFCRPIRSR